MRPQHLVMEGFLAYRRRTEIDFGDADLFVLSGPTGAGKSSVIDGMTFALYGSIPRLGKGSVAPLIAAQADRAKVSFRFSVGDQTYTAARLLERTRTGATTTEARLQRGAEDEVLAGNPDEVTAEVSRLLGLSYEHFIKAVVLPQGAFADFLTDKPKDRQALLGELLDMGLYEQIMQLANIRAKLAEGRVKSVVDSLAKLEVVSPEQVYEAEQLLKAVVRAREELPARLEALDELASALDQARSRHVAAETSVQRLRVIESPDDLDTLEADLHSARRQVESTESDLAAVLEEGKTIGAALTALPEITRLESWLAERVLQLDLADQKSRLHLETLGEAVDMSVLERDEIRRALDLARIEHAAHGLRRGLAVGDVCPVCHSRVAELDEETGEADLSLDRLSEDARLTEETAARARDELKEAEGQARQIERQTEELSRRLEDAPDVETLEGTIASVRGLIDSRTANEQAASSARAAVEAAREMVVALHERSAGLRDALLSARDEVAVEKPPIPGDDVVEAWRRFDRWRLDLMARRTEELAGLQKQVDASAAAASEALEEFRAWLEVFGIGATGAPDRDLALAEAARRAEIEEMEKTIAHAKELEDELIVETTQARVAKALGDHLKANNFEAWLLEEAMDVLIDGANGLLHDLSAGSYSLRANKNQFEVVDHRNAELTRTTRSLSGGETFLVALSLALSMADQLAELTGMTSRLESVFLDEGFGSLDQESLDVVASVLDELVGRGRTVGIVTHVRELADRIPVRYEVTKGPETATIGRVGE